MDSRSEARARVRRRVPATPDAAFRAWLEPQKLSRWMLAPGPRERIAHVAVDARVGSPFSIVLIRDGEAIEHRGTYLEIVRPERLAFTWAVPSRSPDEARVEVAFAPAGDECEVTVTHVLHPRWADYVPQAEVAWTRMLEALVVLLA